LRGHGQSGIGPSRLRDHGDDLLAIIGQFELDRPFVIGASYGAFVALEVASRAPSASGGVVNIDGPLVDRDDAVEWSSDHPSWSERRESFRASIAKRPDQWSGPRDELAVRLSEVPEESRAFKSPRQYLSLGRVALVGAGVALPLDGAPVGALLEDDARWAGGSGARPECKTEDVATGGAGVEYHGGTP
jgi:pimeloyl-ACP methyl ester carboxylesterase